MSASASRDEVVLPGRADRSAPAARRGIRAAWAEAALAVAAFAALCVVVLSVAPQTAEPDDGAYRASIVAMTEGHFLTLSTAQAEALARKLGDNPAAPPNQWIELSRRAVYQREGSRLSVPRGAVRGARHHPLGAAVLRGTRLPRAVRRRPALARALRRPRRGGSVLLIRSRAGVRLARLHADVHRRLADRGRFRRSCCGRCWQPRPVRGGAPGPASPGSLALEIATFVRYTNIVILGCAVVAVIVAWRLRAARLPLRTLCWWLASVAVFGAGVAIFDDLVYGGPLTTGYQPGEVTFALGAIGPNLRIMPAHLMQAMPMLVLGLIALAWIIVRWLVLRRAGGQAGAAARRDLWVGARPGRVVVRDLGPVLRVHLDDRPDQRHRAGRQVLRSGDRRDRPARRLAGDQDSRP